MNGNRALVSEYEKLSVDENIQLVVCPPFVYLNNFTTHVLGAQNCGEHLAGAYTGELSASHLKEVGCSFVILGHSERRGYENNRIINQKAKMAVQAGLRPIICLGESLEEHQEGRTKAVLLGQIDRLTHGLQKGGYLVAYEPLWAIGSGLTPNADEISRVVDILSQYAPVLYGGSVSEENAPWLIQIPRLKGFLIGNASLDIGKMQKISKIVFSNL